MTKSSNQSLENKQCVGAVQTKRNDTKPGLPPQNMLNKRVWAKTKPEQNTTRTKQKQPLKKIISACYIKSVYKPLLLRNDSLRALITTPLWKKKNQQRDKIKTYTTKVNLIVPNLLPSNTHPPQKKNKLHPPYSILQRPAIKKRYAYAAMGFPWRRQQENTPSWLDKYYNRKHDQITKTKKNTTRFFAIGLRKFYTLNDWALTSIWKKTSSTATKTPNLQTLKKIDNVVYSKLRRIKKQKAKKKDSKNKKYTIKDLGHRFSTHLHQTLNTENRSPKTTIKTKQINTHIANLHRFVYGPINLTKRINSVQSTKIKKTKPHHTNKINRQHTKKYNFLE